MIKIFEGINEKNKQKLLRMLEANTFTFAKGNTILKNINNDNVVGIIKRGCIQIIRTDDNGVQSIIDEIKENKIFGSYLSYLKSNEYSIFTKEDSEIILIDYDVLINYDQINKDFYNQFIKNLLKIVISNMQIMTERIEILTRKTIRNRLLEYFNIESKKRASKHIYLSSSYTSLAHYLGVDRSAMMRELKNLKEEGIIEVKGKKITLLSDKYISIYI